MYNISLSTLTGGTLPKCVCQHLFRSYVRCSPEGSEPYYNSLLDVGRGEFVEGYQLEKEAIGPHCVEQLATEMWDSLATRWAKEEVTWSCPSCNVSVTNAEESLYGKITAGDQCSCEGDLSPTMKSVALSVLKEALISVTKCD